MCDKISGFGKTHGVYAVRSEDTYGDICKCRDDKQWKEEIIASSHLGCKKDCHQRRMHDTAHDPRHSHQRKILLRQLESEIEIIHYIRKQKPGESSDEQRRSECSADTSGSVGCGCGECLCQSYGSDEEDKKPYVVSVYIEKCSVNYIRDISQKKIVDSLITLAVKRRKKENKPRHYNAADKNLQTGMS